MEKILNYINGKLVEPTNGNYLDNYNPSNGQVYSLIPDSEKQDIDNAVSAAKEAFKSWSKTPKQKRSDILMKLADTIEKYSEELIKAESKDNGKPESLAAIVDIPRAPANIRFFAGAILHDSSEMHEMDGVAINYTLRQPLGVAACISPWNLPLYLLTWKIAPALAAGNTVVAKPSEVTPMTAYLFSKICIFFSVVTPYELFCFIYSSLPTLKSQSIINLSIIHTCFNLSSSGNLIFLCISDIILLYCNPNKYKS